MKKIPALLLLIIILIAAFTPCCPGGDACADEVTPLTQQHEPEAGNGQGCSPFFSCTACPGFVSPATLMVMAVRTDIYPQYFDAAVGNSAIPYYSTPWQPPRAS